MKGSPRKAVRAWWKAMPLKRQVQWRLAEDAAGILAMLAVAAYAFLSSSFGQWLGIVWSFMAVGQISFVMWQRWRALHSPLFYLAAVKHDLGARDE